MSELIALVLGGVAIEPDCGPIRMRYEPFGGSSELRMADGAGYKQTHWRKTRISASSSGYLDPALEHLDYSRPLELWCIKQLMVGGSALAYEIPPADKRRPDLDPLGFALVGVRWVETPLVLDANVATLTPVPGASRYRVGWYPRYLVLTDGVLSEFDEARGVYDWSLEARER